MRDTSVPDPAEQVAVIDIGSNSVRLVAFRVEGRTLWPLFNEKVAAGLGREVATTGALSAKGMELALEALRRFRAVVAAMGVDRVIVAATAAVREAADGEAFARRVAAETGFEVRILSGEDEARLSALGAAAGIPDAQGLAGDLGGLSLELVPLRGGAPGRGATFALGPFAAGMDAEPEVRRRRMAKRLAAGGDLSGRTFYAIGGAWRALAQIQMRIEGYPLGILQQYAMSATAAVRACRFVAAQSRGSLAQIPDLSRRRAAALPHAALVLESLIARFEIERVVTSTWGLREGLVFETLPERVRSRDPLIDGLAALGARRGDAEALGQALEVWLAPVFRPLPPVFDAATDKRLVAAVCRLGELGARLHPDHRAELVFEQVLWAPVVGVTHVERAFVAAAAYGRHSEAPVPFDIVDRLLEPSAQARAAALGAAVRLGCDLSGRQPSLLSRTSLGFDGRTVDLRSGAAELLGGERVAKRAETLGRLLTATSAS